MHNEDYTLVLQGKLHEHTVRMCNSHKEMQTIVSTWESDIPAEEFLESALRPNLTIIVNSVPNVETVDNQANRYYQYFSSLHGIEAAKTKFVIKARTDEYYSNLESIIAASISTPEKIVTNDVFFRKTRFYPYHPSDHLMLGKAEYFISVFKECIHQCENENVPPKAVPEQQFAMTFISQREGVPYSQLPSREEEKKVNALMMKYFDIVSTKELGNFHVRYNYLKKQWETVDYIDIERDVYTSHSLEKEL